MFSRLLWMLSVFSCSASEECYYLRTPKLRHYTYREYKTVSGVSRCFEECRRSVNCFAFSFSPLVSYRNCLLSDSSNMEKDFVKDSAWDLYYMKQCDHNDDHYGREDQDYRDDCFRIYAPKHRLREDAVYKSRRVKSIQECKDSCTEDCSSFEASLGREVGEILCLFSDRRYIDEYIIRDEESDVFSNACFRDNENDVIGRQMYTANGAKCDVGGCRLNQDVGFWYCTLEGDTAWDYCCRPGERCREGEKGGEPWCYVGETGSDQWRPCV